MNVGIDIRHIGAGQKGGIPEYTLHCIDALVRNSPRTQFKLFYAGRRPPLIPAHWERQRNIMLKYYAFPNRVLDPSIKFLHTPALDRLLGGIDVFLSPHFLLTALSPVCPRVLIIHDLSFVRFPHLFALQDRLWHGFMNPASQARTAQALVAVSEASRRDLMDLWGIAENKIHTVYSGLAQDMISESFTSQQKEAVRKKYNLPQNFILALSVIEPRKNYTTLIHAFELLKRSASEATRHTALVIAGPHASGAQEVIAAAKKSLVGNDILFTGFIAPQDKPCVYDLAQLFVYPSVFEGFGFPPLEAMARGIPTIVSNRSSLPEITGDGALAVDPYNVSGLAQAMEELLEDREAREYVVARGQEKAKEYSWSRTARELQAILEDTVDTTKTS